MHVFYFEYKTMKISVQKQIELILLSFIILMATSCTEQINFSVIGTIENGGNTKIYLYRMDLHSDMLIDSMKMKKGGEFRFKMPPLKEPTFFKLQLTPNNFITLLGDTTEQIVIKAAKESFSRNYIVENSQGSALVQTLNSKIVDLRNDNIEIDDYKKFIGEFVLFNARSFASYYALFQTYSNNSLVLDIWDKKEQVYFAAIATSLNILYPDSERVKHLYNLVLTVKAEQRSEELIEKLMSHATDEVPEIKEKDINGNEIALSSLRGKIVLLSFWASWDEAANRENAFLKTIYPKYKSNGFEIYQVALEQSKVVWESTLIQHEIPWISVSDLQHAESYPARVYNVQKLPANYLISRDGQIIGKDLFGSMLEDRLERLLK